MSYSLGFKKIPDDVAVGKRNTNYVASLDLDLDLYDDISSIENWYNSDVMDWSRRRDEIKPLFFAEAGVDLSSFESLSDEEKEIGARLFFIPYALRLTIFTDEEDMENWKFLLTETKTSRKECIEAMRQAVGNKIRTESLSLQETQHFDSDTTLMIALFERSNHPEFNLWLNNLSGTIDGVTIDHTIDGFSSKSYYDLSLKTELLAIYNGAY